MDLKIALVNASARNLTETLPAVHNSESSEGLSSMSDIEEEPPGPFIIILQWDESVTMTYVSPSVEENLGYKPKELVGKSVFTMFHPDDMSKLLQLHQSNLETHPVAQLLHIRHRRKTFDQEDQWVWMDMAANMCTDCGLLVIGQSCCFTRNIAWRSSAEDVYNFKGGSQVAISNWNHRGQIQNRFSETVKLIHSESPTNMEQRAGLILNRFSIERTIMFASPVVSQVLNCHPEALIGSSIYLHIKHSQREFVHLLLINTSESELIAKTRFTWCTLNESNEEFEVEVAFTYARDGVVCIIRRYY